MESLNSPSQNPELRSEQPPQQTGEAFQYLKPVEAQAPVEQGKETREVFNDQPTSGPPVAQTPQPPVPPVLDVNLTTTTPQDDTQQDDSTPAVAADVDLIEKEWVDKAKKIVNQTRDDPHEQESAVGRLQADYLKKRYGREVKLANDG